MNNATPRMRTSLLLAALLHICLASAPAYATPDVFDNLRTKWKTRSSTIAPLPPGDPDVALQVANSSNAAQVYWDAFNASPSRTNLWPDLPLGTVSANITTTVSRLNTLAGAYNSSSSAYYHRADVRQAILDGLDWLVANKYTATGTGYDNWWDWQIGTPVNLNNLMMTFYAEFTPAQIASYLACIDHYMPDPTRRASMNGTVNSSSVVEEAANRLDKAQISVLGGILGKNGSKIDAGRNAISAALAYVAAGDGYYTDGSFLQHVNVPYVGSYGTVLLSGINKLYYILNDSLWPISNDPNYLNPYDWVMNTYRPFIYDGAMMDNQRGRSIARQFSTDHNIGRQTITLMAELAQVLPAAQGAELRSLVKGWALRDDSFGSSYFTPKPSDLNGNMAGVSNFDIALVKSAINDASIVAAPEPSETRYFPSADRAVSRRDGHAFALSMFSNRISAFEYGGGENSRGWWTGMGMTYLYNADQTQYTNNFWSTIDAWRLPGTTTDHSGSGTPLTYHHYPNPKTGVGGAELNRQFATAAMEFATNNVTGSTLTGKKAWFMFGDRIVAVGSGITTIDGANVETIVENRVLNANGDNTLAVNAIDTFKPVTLGWSENMPTTKWVHLTGNASSGSDIGYVFPDQPAVNAKRESRSGAWRDIHTAGGTAIVNNNFLSLALDHGTNPTDAAYSYILLPNYSAQQTAQFALTNPITVMERSTAATAVRDNAQGLTGIVFWNDAVKTVNAGGQAFLSSDKKAVAMVEQQGNSVQLAVADPTQLNTGNINLELNLNASVISKDAAITVTQTSPTVKMTVAVNGSMGKSFKAQLAINTTSTLAPNDDAFVRDGSAYANVNYGSMKTLTVKQDVAGYARKAALKFDLAAISGTITSAKLTLVPVAMGTASGMIHKLYQTTTDNWAESAVTWNNLPANGSLLGSWSVPATVTTPVEIDVTSAANGVLSGSKLLSMVVEAAANYGAAGSVDYGAKEHLTLAHRPTLVVTYH